MSNLDFYKNAGVKKEAPKPINFVMQKAKGVAQKTIDVTSSVLAAPAVAVQKVRGLKADIQRGNTLYNEGYGGKRDSVFKIAKQGRSGGKRKR